MIDPVLYTWQPSPLTILSICCALAASIWLMCSILPKLRLITTLSRQGSRIQPSGKPVGVSVIVSTGIHSNRLASLIENILAQQYPATIEIIIVNTGGEDYTETAIREIQTRYPQVKNTFVPAGSRNLSRRKLAITLGIKAATQPVILLTCANATPPDNNWISAMMRHFSDNTADIVIGSTTLHGTDSSTTLGVTRSFDALLCALRKIPAAAAGNPVGADSANLAYRRQLFFDQNGFADTLHLNYGDDDIFVSDIAKDRQLAVELSPQSILEITEDNPRRIYDLEKTSRSITHSRLRRTPFIISGFNTFLWWIWLICSVAAIILGLPSILPAAIISCIAVALLIPILIFWKKAATALRLSSPCSTMLPLQLLHPIYKMHRKIKMGRNIRNYTWQN